MNLQYIIIGVIIVAAVAFVGFSIYKAFAGKGCPGCGPRSCCDSDNTTDCTEDKAEEGR